MINNVIVGLGIDKLTSMKTVDLHIKNMVCSRCIIVVKQVLKNLNIQVKHIELGHVSCLTPLNVSLSNVALALKKYDLELIQQEEAILLEKIKTTAIEYVQYVEKETDPIILSVFLTQKLGKHYQYISKCFSKHTNNTVEKYVILQKIERVKELLQFKELSVGQIAKKLKYSSIHHLSNQFRKEVGVSISTYKKNLLPKRKFIDHILQ